MLDDARSNRRAAASRVLRPIHIPLEGSVEESKRPNDRQVSSLRSFSD